MLYILLWAIGFQCICILLTEPDRFAHGICCDTVTDNGFKAINKMSFMIDHVVIANGIKAAGYEQ
jgi:hypothetical protein